MIVILRRFCINQDKNPTKNPKRFRKICFTITLLIQHLLFYSGCLPQDCQRETWIQYGAGSYCMKIRHYWDFKFQTFSYTPMVSAPPLKTRGPGKMGFKRRGEIYIFCKIRGDCPLRGAKIQCSRI